MELLALKIRPCLEALGSLFFPPHCCACDDRIDSGYLCATCSSALVRIGEACCLVCSHSMRGLPTGLCTNCNGRALSFHCVVAVCQSKGVVRELIHRFKYGRELHLRSLLGSLLIEGLQDHRLRHVAFDCITPVPLHPLKLREREFNQAEELAAILSRFSRIPLKNCLKRTRYTVTQTQFDRLIRMRNLQGAFKVGKNHDVSEKTILLVDDVMTTASTLNECARTLLEAGAHAVYGITIARG
ncbi:MAG: ComF family protein [Chthoniobacterales bacterium]